MRGCLVRSPLRARTTDCARLRNRDSRCVIYAKLRVGTYVANRFRHFSIPVSIAVSIRQLVRFQTNFHSNRVIRSSKSSGLSFNSKFASARHLNFKFKLNFQQRLLFFFTWPVTGFYRIIARCLLLAHTHNSKRDYCSMFVFAARYVAAPAFPWCIITHTIASLRYYLTGFAVESFF